MITLIKNRLAFDRSLKYAHYNTYVEAIHKDRPDKVVRVLTERLPQGSLKWVDPDYRTVYVESSRWKFIPVPSTTAKRLEWIVYRDTKEVVLAHLSYLQGVANITHQCYPVYCDPDDHLWYIKPDAFFDRGADWCIALWSPSRNEEMRVKYSHGPFDWMFYLNGTVDTNVNPELWAGRIELLSRH